MRFSKNIEIRFMRRKSAASLRRWLVSGWAFDTPAAGPCFGFRVFGLSASIYPWLPNNKRCHLF